MREKVDQFILKCRFKAMENFMKEEKGASDMVVIIVIIVIVIGVAGLFKEQLEGAIRAVFGKLINFIG